MNPFDCPQRDRFFNNLPLPWYNLCPIDEDGVPLTDQQSPYALYHCERVARQQIQEIQQASERVGRLFIHLWQVVRQLDETALLEYGFPPETIRLIKHDPLPPFCMRLDWCWNPAQNLRKVVEVNPQTPSFWFECTEGNRRLAEHFGLTDPVPGSSEVLRVTLNRHLERVAATLHKPLEKCRIAFTALNNAEDMGTMRWLSYHCEQESLVFPLEYLRIENGKHLFYGRTGQMIDILFMWYPVEWAIHDTDEQGELLWPALEELILKNKVAIVNFGSAFLLQPKSMFALLYDLGLGFLSDEDAATLLDYLPKTALEPEAIGPTYFAKPILGRQGEGSFAVRQRVTAYRSHNNAAWYTEQPYVYQELLEFPQVTIGDRQMSAVWGAWLYNNGEDQLIAGSVGTRVSEGTITDDASYWCPIGCDP